MSRKTQMIADHVRSQLSFYDFVAEDAYKVFLKCDPPATWGEKEFYFLLQCAWDITFLHPLPEWKAQMEKECTANACYLAELYAFHSDKVLLALRKFRDLQKSWFASPEKSVTMRIANSESFRRLILPPKISKQRPDFLHVFSVIGNELLNSPGSESGKAEQPKVEETLKMRKIIDNRLDRFWNDKAEVLAAELKVSPKTIEHARERVRRVKPFIFPDRSKAVKS